MADLNLEAAVLQPHLPQVSIISPVSGANLPAGSIIPIGVDAMQFDSAIATTTISANGSQISTLQPPAYTTTWTPTPGHYSLRAQATDATGISNVSPPVYIDVVGTGGTLTATHSGPPSTPIDLTTIGTADWVMFKYCNSSNSRNSVPNSPSVIRKAGVGPLISSYTVLGDYSGCYGEAVGETTEEGNPHAVGIAYEDGTPDSQETNLTCCFEVAYNGVPGNGLEFTVSADTTPRTLQIYAGLFGTQNSGGKLTAFLSDGSAPVLVDSSFVMPMDSGITTEYSGIIYNITFSAASPGQTLTIRLTLDSVGSYSSIGLFAAALSGSPLNFTPEITEITPSRGAAGSQASIYGTGFGASQGTNTVLFGGTVATVTNWTANRIDIVVPPLPAGSQVVSVPGVVIGSINYTIVPTVTGISPTVEAPGTLITITGASFGSIQGSSTVTVGGLPAAVTMWSDTQIQAQVPSSIGDGSQSVIVTVAGASSTGVIFTVLPPVINAISPTGGIAGASITITGNYFGNAQGTSSVTVGGVPATVTNWGDTQIQMQLPSSTGPGIQNVVVNVGTLSSSGGFGFAVTPTISNITPFSGLPGTFVKIVGTNFGSSNSSWGHSVTFNGISAQITNWEPNIIEVMVPTGASTGPVVVTSSNMSANGSVFTVPTGPTITGLSPAYGPVGTNVTISGGNFGILGGGVNATFNGVSCANCTGFKGAIVSSILTNYTVMATVPVGATTGPVVVTNLPPPPGGTSSAALVSHRASTKDNTASSGSDGNNNYIFTVTAGITSVVPCQGNVGTIVTINGANFGPAQGNSTITFHGIPATPSSWTDTVIVVPVPNGATTGNVAITVNGETNVGPLFMLPPVINSLSPSTGPVGSIVTVSGSNFGVSQGLSNIAFGAVLATPTQWSQDRIVVPVPQGAVTGSVVVDIPGLTSNAVLFTVGSATTGSISGIVTNASNGALLSGVSVQALLSNHPIGSTISAADGTYIISNLAPGTYDLMAGVAGFGTSVISGINVTLNGITAVNVPLGPPGAIAGTVTQSDGVTPIAGANVTVVEGSDTVATATTSSSGAYSVSNLAVASYSVQVFVPGYSAGSQTGITVSAGQTTNANFILSGQPIITYTYDELGRVVGVTDSVKGTAGYSYDAVGNILNITRGNTGQVSVLDFTPKSGPIGTVITISGTSFSVNAQQDAVTFSGASTTASLATSNQLAVTVPIGTTTGPIAVITPNGSATSSVSFNVTTSATAPSITSFSPAMANVGTTVTILGSGFDVPANDRIAFNPFPAVDLPKMPRTVDW